MFSLFGHAVLALAEGISGPFIAVQRKQMRQLRSKFLPTATKTHYCYGLYEEIRWSVLQYG